MPITIYIPSITIPGTYYRERIRKNGHLSKKFIYHFDFCGWSILRKTVDFETIIDDILLPEKKKINYECLRPYLLNMIEFIRMNDDVTTKDFIFEVKEFDNLFDYIDQLKKTYQYVQVEKRNGKWEISPFEMDEDNIK